MINLKDINVGNDGALPKLLQPGNNTCKINSIFIEPNKFKEGAFYIILNLESKPIEGFEGFFIDREDESQGRYQGQTGRVKSYLYGYEDGVTKGGTVVKRDDGMLKFIKKLCITLGLQQWLDDQENKHETVESLFTAFETERPYADIYTDYCIAGKEYMKNNYKNYELFLPNGSKDGNPFGKIKPLIFDESKHIVVKKAATTVSEFTTDAPIAVEHKDQFDL